MAAKTAPLSSEDHEELLRIVREAEAPVLVSHVTKHAATSRRAKPAEATAIFEQFVSDGRLSSFPASTAKGKPRYWDRDPLEVGRGAVREIVERAEEPLTVAQVKKQLKLPFKLSDAEITSLLDEGIQSGQLHSIPAKTEKSPPRYWHKDANEFARISLRAHLRDKGPQTETGLKRPVKWLDNVRYKQLVESLISERAIFRHPSVGTSKKSNYGDRPPAPEPYLKDVRTRLEKVVDKLKSADVPLVDLRRAIIQVIEQAGVPFPSASTNGEPVSSPTGQSVDLVALITQLEPGAARGALVATRDLRRAARLDKAAFDTHALDLARQGKVVLHRHDFASSLSPDERDELVTDGQGNYYVGLALRTSGES